MMMIMMMMMMMIMIMMMMTRMMMMMMSFMPLCFLPLKHHCCCCCYYYYFFLLCQKLNKPREHNKQSLTEDVSLCKYIHVCAISVSVNHNFGTSVTICLSPHNRTSLIGNLISDILTPKHGY